MQEFKSTWHKMKEIVVLSLNIIYIKDSLQQLERFRARLIYLNMSEGSIDVVQSELQKRKRNLHKRLKELLENLMNSEKTDTNFCFVIEKEFACLTRKQLEQGYALFTNVRGDSYALNLRNGSLLPIVNPELTFSDRNIMFLEYQAHHTQSIYDFFDIDLTDPLKNEIRY